jgi:hypothetical protein
VSGFWRLWCPVCADLRQTRIPSNAPLSADDRSTPAVVAEYEAHLRQRHGEKRK